MRRIAAALIVPAVLLLLACGSSSSTSSSSTNSPSTAAPSPSAAPVVSPPQTTTTAPVASTAAVAPPSSSDTAAAGFSCADIGGVFVAHGTDGRGDCEPADPRPQCHVAPADQDGNYVAGFELDPPFPQGTVARTVVRTMLLGVDGVSGASNADCWRLPPR